MRVLITGVDGYLGWPLSIYLAKRGHEVAGIDNYLRRAWVGEMGSQSAIPIAKMADRLLAAIQQVPSEGSIARSSTELSPSTAPRRM